MSYLDEVRGAYAQYGLKAALGVAIAAPWVAVWKWFGKKGNS
jgi:hypothetical protein